MIDPKTGLYVDKSKIITEGKPRVSRVLTQERDWKRPSEELPEENKPVIIRLMHLKDVDFEDENYIYPIEDNLVGYVNGGKWIISTPFPKYDYSRLSNKAVINENVEVTHWAELMEGELKGWESRFDRIREYDKLELLVDPANEEVVYRSLMWAAHFIAMAAGPEFQDRNNELRISYEVICDLQNAIDKGDWNGNN